MQLEKITFLYMHKASANTVIIPNEASRPLLTNVKKEEKKFVFIL